MKTRGIQSILASATVILLFACSGGSRPESASDEQDLTSDTVATGPTKPQFEVGKSFQNQLSHTLSGYLKVKDALVSSDPDAAKTEAASLKAILKAMDPGMLSGTALNDWTGYSNNLDMALAEIISTADLESQRTAFGTLSENMYRAIKAFGLGGDTAFYEFCPMAFNNRGAYWLSDSKEIKNPYFGDKMLTCGRVTEELQ